MRKTLLLLVPVLLSACTYGITLDDAAKNVRTAWGGDVSGCRDMGKVTVSVQDHIGPVDRNNITVRDELEVLARNQAAELHADTIKPLADPTDGSQPWGAYQCGARPVGPAARPPVAPNNSNSPAPAGKAQTFPVHSG
ncbi:DUF4156 domain-containing protein [Rhodanobacter sp. A1T4]|uniref:DUF4156 domain-containing protein n=1 Tax=Rhodanobacter sp. A1T4 TaxID=2723087 RepID=UPI00160E3585|nr:DUF4156 domain-containing protein [Rhodanobacter sp. A1T4]MBB6248839.1 hypothetical protein [Rhodanobacter sp. A1T4]